MRSIDKFSGKAAAYAKHRPSYPTAYLDYLLMMNDLAVDAVIADIGSGTGILTKQLLDRGLQVIAVEPNDDMRQTAEASLSTYPNYTSIDGTAEQTGLSSQSMDLITVAQAFHWFEPDRFQAECRRVLKWNKQVALVWNSRDASSELVRADHRLCTTYCPLFKGFSGGIEEKPEVFGQFFREGKYEYQEFAHPIELDLESFIGRHLSASYSLKSGDEHYELYIEAITELFEQYADGKVITVPNLTRSYLGKV